MIESVKPGLYRLEIPLPDTPLKRLNSYIIKGRERNLIIDTGFNHQESLEAMQQGLRELEIDLNRTDLFITHMHADHSGLVSHLATDTSKVYCSQADAGIINSKGNWAQIFQRALKNGFFQEKDMTEFLPGKKYRTASKIDFTIVGEGDLITVDDYSFVCVATPGHTPGHTCLYEPEKRLLVSGDHILYKITPNISQWFNNYNPLGDYLKSLDKVYKLPIDLVLPGHRSLFTDCQARIDELKKHHENRCEEILSILGNSKLNAYTIASRMKWDLSYEQWELFPIPQKWFATGEAMAHLKYLEEKGLVQETEEETILYFRTDV